MSAPAGDPAYKAITWKIGYQQRQFETAGPSVATALANPPPALLVAVGKPSTPTGQLPAPTPPVPEPTPIYD